MTDLHPRIVFAACLLIGVAAVAATLSKSPIAVIGENGTTTGLLATVEQPLSACQRGETLPRGTSAIRLRVDDFLGPRVKAGVLERGDVIAEGEHGSGWTGGVVTVPVKPLSTTRRGVDLCFSIFGNRDETDELVGEPTTPARAAFTGSGSLPGRLHIEYMQESRASWWSLALRVARRMGLGHAWSGTWSAFAVLALMGGVLLLCSRQILRGLR
jgi:hypothetical protein